MPWRWSQCKQYQDDGLVDCSAAFENAESLVPSTAMPAVTGKRLLQKWSSQFSWLVTKNDTVQCKYCLWWQCPKPRNSVFRLHEQSHSHVQAAEQNGAIITGAPAIQEFQDCLQRRRQGVSFRKAKEDAGRKKDLKLTFCLAEAVLEREQRALRKASAVTVSQDAQGQLLSVRYCAAVSCASTD